MAATVAEVQAAAGAEAHLRRDLAALANARTRANAVVAVAEATVQASGVAGTIGSRREADAYLATAQAHRARLDAADDPDTWNALARRWEGLANPYEVARARWREAEALLASGEGRSARGRARAPLQAAAVLGIELRARPMLRELRELASRALIPLPEGIDAVLDGENGSGPGHPLPAPISTARPIMVGGSLDEQSALVRGVVGVPAVARTNTFGLSRREHEVLGLISQGRTNREIGERLFISQTTVGVHVGNLLAKLGVSGRVEAATVAIRLGLTENH